ncbi:ISAzo13-like element transposase-related protein [Planktothrix serta]|uniref:ISAzo13-like element transposase-related protein n=1 Tax=Planktothrix serta TaxID=1678310 RepID=UPI0009F86F8F|nr:hypothetical protein [Planktothrix serta]
MVGECGSNNANHYIFKQDLQKLVDEIGIEIRIAHYPPYTSNMKFLNVCYKYLIGWLINFFYPLFPIFFSPCSLFPVPCSLAICSTNLRISYKYNPIEHRLFPHLTRACQGVIFTSLGLVKTLMEKTRTNTGLSVVVNVVDQVYQTGRKVTDHFKKTLKIVFDEYLPKWNYRAVPQLTH